MQTSVLVCSFQEPTFPGLQVDFQVVKSKQQEL